MCVEIEATNRSLGKQFLKFHYFEIIAMINIMVDIILKIDIIRP